MNSESLIIKNFGPIEDVCFDDIPDLVVIIGESGAGKSTIMKVLILFRWIYKKMCIRSYFKNAGLNSPFRFRFETYVRNNGFAGYLKDGTEIIYTRNGITISYKDKCLDTKANIPSDAMSIDKMSFISDKRNMIPDFLAKGVKEYSVSYFLNETYSDFLEASKTIDNISIPYLNVNLVKQRVSSAMQYFIDRKSEEINYKVRFENASSGMQNAIPLEVLIEYFTKHYNLIDSFNKSLLSYLVDSDMVSDFKPTSNVGAIKNRNVFIHIEEPELSLYPDMQVKQMESIIKKCFTQRLDYDVKIILTTHSPYIANYMNLVSKSGLMAFDNMSVYHIFDGYIECLNHPIEKVFDTKTLSDAIENIYAKYNEYNTR